MVQPQVSLPAQALYGIQHMQIQNKIISWIKLNLPTLWHEHYCSRTTEIIESNQNIIYVKTPDKKQENQLYVTANA